MGVRGLFTYCSKLRKKATMNANHVGIDGFSILYLFREDRKGLEAYLRGLPGKLTFVMDKRAAKEKLDVVKERREQRKEAKEEASSLSEFAQSPSFDEIDPIEPITSAPAFPFG